LAKYNADEKTSLFEPIEITLEGKKYVIEKITDNMLSAVMTLGKKNDANTLSKQLSILLNADEKEFKNIDVRKLGNVLKFITDEYTKSISIKGESKNA